MVRIDQIEDDVNYELEVTPMLNYRDMCFIGDPTEISFNRLKWVPARELLITTIL